MQQFHAQPPRRPVHVAQEASPPQLDRLTLFTFFWGITRLFHHFSFPVWVDTLAPLSWGVFLTAIWGMVQPRSILALIALLTMSILRTIHWMPFHPNHILFEVIVDAGILLAILYQAFKALRSGKSLADRGFREAIFQSFAPMGAISLTILYFFGTFHKLNTDYLNLDIGCGTILTEGIIGKPVPTWLKIVVTYGTLLVEGGIPLLLLFSRTRMAGLLLGILFHFLLAFNLHPGIYSFSALLYGYWLFYLPPNVTGHLHAAGHTLSTYLRELPRRMLLISLLLMATSLALATAYIWHLGLFLVGLVYFWLFALVYLGVFLYLVRVQGMGVSQRWKSFRLTNPVLFIFPVLVALNGFSPYLGLKTESSFSMFSNLRTEGGQNNHLFMPAFTQTTGWQDKLVKIRQTDVKEFNKYMRDKQLITLFEFQRIISTKNHDLFVDYELNGQPARLEVINGKANNPALVQRHSWLAYKLLHFRPVYEQGCFCQH